MDVLWCCPGSSRIDGNAAVAIDSRLGLGDDLFLCAIVQHDMKHSARQRDISDVGRGEGTCSF